MKKSKFIYNLFKQVDEFNSNNEFSFKCSIKEYHHKSLIPKKAYRKDALNYFKDVVFPHKQAVIDASEEIKKILKLDNESLLSHCQSKIPRSYLDLDDLSFENHDNSKFTAIESEAYIRAFYKPSKLYLGEKLNPVAWRYHIMYNSHHPESIYNVEVFKKEEDVLEFIIELISDWIAAGKIYGGNLKEWYPKCGKPKIEFLGKEIVEVVDLIIEKYLENTQN